MLVCDLNSSGSSIPKQAYDNACHQAVQFMVQKGVSCLLFDDVDGFYHLVVTSEKHWFMVCSDDAFTLKNLGLALSFESDIKLIEWFDERLEENGSTALFYFENGIITLNPKN